MLLSEDHKRSKYIFVTVISVVVGSAVLYWLRASSLYPGVDYGVDVYYHIKAGDMFPYFCTAKKFPWAVMSIWRTNFSDKELGFHFIIYLLRHITRFIGISQNPPFNFINACFFVCILAFYGGWGYLKCRKISFVIPVLLAFISPLFLQKLIILRPDLISIFLFSISVFILIGDSSLYRKGFYTFILGWLYSVCYSVPHVLLIPVIIYCIACLFSTETLKEKCKNFILIVFAVIGLAVGLTVHPQFPNTFLNLYIQGYEVVLNILGISSSKVGMGAGLEPPAISDVLQNFLLYILFLINIFIFWVSDKFINREKKFFLLTLQIITVIGFFFSKRTIEYAVPSVIICFGYLAGTLGNEKEKIADFFSNLKLLFIVVIVFAVITIPVDRSMLPKFLLPPCYDFGNWQKKNLPKGTYIGLLNFGDFPRLFYTAPELKYSMAMDPMFSYFAYPERSNTIEQFRLGNDRNITPKELAKAYGTNLVYAPKYCHLAVMYLLDKGAELIYYDKEGCLLKL